MKKESIEIFTCIVVSNHNHGKKLIAEMIKKIP
jgi:hypothetical protein